MKPEKLFVYSRLVNATKHINEFQQCEIFDVLQRIEQHNDHLIDNNNQRQKSFQLFVSGQQVLTKVF